VEENVSGSAVAAARGARKSALASTTIAIHGQTWSGAASIVMAWVEVKRGSGTIASTGSSRRCSNAVAMQVANAMTKWEEHLLYRSDRRADRP